jgi:competence protein ComEC
MGSELLLVNSLYVPILSASYIYTKSNNAYQNSMQAYRYISLKSVPSVRLLVAFIAGILLQWYVALSITTVIIATVVVIALAVGFSFLPQYRKFTVQWLGGVLILLLFTAGGALLTYTSNIEHQPDWFQNHYSKGTTIIATIDEPLVAKPNSYKAIARVAAVQNNNTVQGSKGNILIYFKKDSTVPHRIGYGTRIAFSKTLQPIQNTGNPGGFDYKRYMLFQNVTSQVYLQANDYVLLPHKDASSFQVFLQKARAYVITALQTYIPGKGEQGVAEALLIGYRNDLDKQLVRSYSNTGVVHIIAISGLHLGMIYGALIFLLSPVKSRRWYRFVMPITVLVVLWLFTLIAGAVPSIVRSAVMFSFIVLGECLRRKGNIYNTLAVSALCILIYNPFYLWDVGFQLSYAAVLSIVVFIKPVYNRLYFENGILNKIWLLAATTLAAQIFTIPIVLFYFHQFPLLFLVTNLVVVPLSSIALFVEIVVVAVAGWTWLATIMGKLAYWMLWFMNSFIQHVERLPFASWQNIQTDVFQAIVLYTIILLLVAWLFARNTKLLLAALVVLFLFTVYTATAIYQAKQQHKLVVYNVPKLTTIDIIQGSESKALISAGVAQDISSQNFYLQPTRLLFRAISNQSNILGANNYLLSIANKTILIVGKSLPDVLLQQKLPVDAVIITGNPKLYMDQLKALVTSPVIVFDNSNSAWKIERWKKDCNSLHLRFHSTAEDGAFVMDCY